MTSGEVVAIVVHDAKDATFAAKGRDAQGKVTNLSGPVSDKYELLSHDVTKDGEKIGVIQLYTSNESVQHELRVLLSTTIGQVILIDLVTIAILVVLIRRVVTRPLVSVMERLKKISEGDGDLTVSLPEEGAREISLLAMSFNTFVAKPRVVIDQVKILNLELATAAEELSVTVEQVERDASSVRDVSDAAQKTASNGVRVITQSVNAMQDISNVVQRAVTTVQGLGDESKNIRTIVDVIENIANQTNLLALNAAIEAARAGEHGRGFAVVADEVRKLAQNTVQATSEVSKTVSSIQTESQKAVEVMKQGQEAVSHVVSLAKQAGEAVLEIDSTVALATDQTQHIATATQELTATIRDMAANIELIASSVEHNSLAAVDMAKTADSVAKKADHLHSITGRFKT